MDGASQVRRANVDAWHRLLEDRKLDPYLAKKWANYAKPNIRLIPSVALDDDTPPGSSKFGGEPDLPVDVGWPTRPAYQYQRQKNDFRPPSAWQEQPLNFLAQINISDVWNAGCDLPLPRSGLLLFFYDIEVQPWGFDPHDAAGWRVLYTDDEKATKRHSNPPGHPSKTRSIRFEPSEGLPGWEWCIQEIIGDDSPDNYKTFLAELDKLTEKDHERISYNGPAFGGWPSPIQAPMELECEMASNGVYAGNGYANPRMREFQKRVSGWRLLLQINSDDELNWMWGDIGNLYFMCREEDIANKRFERAWTIFQCT